MALSNKNVRHPPAIKNVSERYWRIDRGQGRNIYALLSNDPQIASDSDLYIGSMETTVLAEDVVDSHNSLLEKYGRQYLERIVKE